MAQECEFVCYGDPSPQAGMRSVPVMGSDGRPIMKNGRPVTRQITTGGVNLKSWRQEVSAAAALFLPAVGQFTGPVFLKVQFRFAMPKSRPAWMRAQGVALKTTAPDSDKLIRAVGDSLTSSGLIKDDAIIAVTRSSKLEVWEAWTGATISLKALDQRDYFAVSS